MSLDNSLCNSSTTTRSNQSRHMVHHHLCLRRALRCSHCPKHQLFNILPTLLKDQTCSQHSRSLSTNNRQEFQAITPLRHHSLSTWLQCIRLFLLLHLRHQLHINSRKCNRSRIWSCLRLPRIALRAMRHSNYSRSQLDRSPGHLKPDTSQLSQQHQLDIHLLSQPPTSQHCRLTL
jgi:hypothetical protein